VNFKKYILNNEIFLTDYNPGCFILQCKYFWMLYVF